MEYEQKVEKTKRKNQTAYRSRDQKAYGFSGRQKRYTQILKVLIPQDDVSCLKNGTRQIVNPDL